MKKDGDNPEMFVNMGREFAVEGIMLYKCALNTDLIP